MTVTQTKHHEIAGTYQETDLDRSKASSAFLLLQVNPCVIRWSTGDLETVTRRKLAQLQKVHQWQTDF